jgi:hypothetical protein
MKVRDSGMPPEDMWSGYEMFAIPTARIVQRTLHAIDIEETMVEAGITVAEPAISLPPYHSSATLTKRNGS